MERKKIMDSGISSILKSISTSDVFAIVRTLYNNDSVILLDWGVNQIGGGVGNPVSLGLFRFEGKCLYQEDIRNWSVILKIIQSPANVGWRNMGEENDQTHWNYWKRELNVYGSNILKFLPEGLIVPNCYKLTEIPGDVALLWLEDISDYLDGKWSLDRYTLTARHLGRLNGIRLSEKDLRIYPWLSINRNRQWVDMMPKWQEIPWQHPVFHDRYPAPFESQFRKMLILSEKFLGKLDLLPITINHGDTYPTNFLSKKDVHGIDQTVALDWALMGVQPIGDDLGQFVFGAINNLPDINYTDIIENLFAAYLEGLNDSELKVDPSLVRFGFTTSAALRVGLFQVFQLSEEIKKITTKPVKKDRSDSTQACFEEIMAKEALNLIEKI